MEALAAREGVRVEALLTGLTPPVARPCIPAFFITYALVHSKSPACHLMPWRGSSQLQTRVSTGGLTFTKPSATFDHQNRGKSLQG
jgi:hypothetical protein